MSITLIIIILTVAVSLYASENEDIKRKLLFNPYSVVHHKKGYKVITHAFIHADLMHLGINMYVLYGFGRNVEYLLSQMFGPIGGVYFITLYVGGIIFATLPSIRKNKDNPHYNSLGASGAVSAVLFAFIILQPMARFTFPPVPAIVFGLFYIGYETYMNNKGRTNIAHDAHLLGAVFGIIFTILLSPSNIINNFIQEILNIF